MNNKPTIENEEDRSGFEYIGNELELFLHADNWKQYVANRLRPYIHGNVLEVGAGLGANSPYFYRDDLPKMIAVEPDTQLCKQFRQRQEQGLIPPACELFEGTLQSCSPDDQFDTIIYMDVLEHIENDDDEVNSALKRLNTGGHLIILCPAHNWLLSSFDQTIGHFRRYNKQMYHELSTRKPLHIEYLDSVGLLASLANKLFLKQSYPTKKQIKLWDRVFVSLSKWIDPIVFHQFGKSVIGVWRA